MCAVAPHVTPGELMPAFRVVALAMVSLLAASVRGHSAQPRSVPAPTTRGAANAGARVAATPVACEAARMASAANARVEVMSEDASKRASILEQICSRQQGRCRLTRRYRATGEPGEAIGWPARRVAVLAAGRTARARARSAAHQRARGDNAAKKSGRIAPVGLLLQRLHDDGIEIAAKRSARVPCAVQRRHRTCASDYVSMKFSTPNRCSHRRSPQPHCRR